MEPGWQLAVCSHNEVGDVCERGWGEQRVAVASARARAAALAESTTQSSSH